MPLADPTISKRSTLNSRRVAAAAAAAASLSSQSSSVPFPVLPVASSSLPVPSASSSARIGLLDPPEPSIMPANPPNPFGLTDDQWSDVRDLISASVTAALRAAPPPTRSKRIEVNSPDEFDGSDPSKVSDFFNQCELVFRSRVEDFRSDEERVNYAAMYLRGSAQRWFMPYLTAEPPIPSPGGSIPSTILDSWSLFKSELSSTLGQDDLSRAASFTLSPLTMADHHHVLKYSIEFRELASHIPGLSDTSLFSDYYRGLAPRIKDDLTKFAWPDTFDQLVSITRTIDQRYWERKEEKARESRRFAPSSVSFGSSSSSSPAPSGTSKPSSIHLDTCDKRSASPAVSLGGIIGPDGKLTASEKQRRRDLGLCLFCGSSEHLRDACPTAPARSASGTSARASATEPNVAGSSTSA